MSDQFHVSEQPDAAAQAAERELARVEATSERVDLNAEISPEAIRTAEVIAFIADNYPDCTDPATVAAACITHEASNAFLMPDYDVTTDIPVIESNIAAVAANLVVAERVETLTVEAAAAVVVLEERNTAAAEVVGTHARLNPEAPPLVIAERTVLDLATPLEPDPASETVEVTLAAATAELATQQAQAEAALLETQTAIETVTADIAVSTAAVATDRAAVGTNRAAVAVVMPAVAAAPEREAVAAEGKAVVYAVEAGTVENDQTAAASAEISTERLVGAEKIQDEYEELRKKMGQKEALQELLRTSENPEHKDRIAQILGNISTLENALPGRSEAVARFIENSNLDLGESNQAAVFANVFASMEASDEFTAEEVATLRQSLHGEVNVETATDARNALAEGLGTETLPDGTTRTIPYTPEEPLALAEGIDAFPDPEAPENMLIRARFEHPSLSGREFKFSCPPSMSGAQATEQINYFCINAIKEESGITGGTQQGLFVTQGDAQIDLSPEGFMTQAARFGRLTEQYLLGGVANESSFLDTEQLNTIAEGFEWMMPQADATGNGAYNDNSEAARAAALGGNGNDGLFFDAQGNLNEENYTRAALYINQQKALGTTEPSFEALRNFLNGGTQEAMV
jgi:hypothetical protein